MTNPTSGRFSRLRRPLMLVAALLKGEELDRRIVAQKLGVGLAAADRQLQSIAEALPGIVKVPVGRRTVFRLNVAALRGAPSLPGMIAACLGGSIGPLFRGTSYERGMTEAREEVLRSARGRKLFRNIDRKFIFLVRGGEVSLPEQAGDLDDLVDSLLRQRWIRFEYRDFDGAESRPEIQPLSLALHEHQLYLVGRSREGKLRPFRFARMREFSVTGQTFEYPEKAVYDPSQLFAASFGIFVGDAYPTTRVVLRLAARWRVHVGTHRWHSSQVITDAADGLRVDLTVRICPELEAWILGFGDEAEVLEPAALRKRIAARARRMAAQYPATPAQHAPPKRRNK